VRAALGGGRQAVRRWAVRSRAVVRAGPDHGGCPLGARRSRPARGCAQARHRM
jgi:hypothetical protein